MLAHLIACLSTLIPAQAGTTSLAPSIATPHLSADALTAQPQVVITPLRWRPRLAASPAGSPAPVGPIALGASVPTLGSGTAGGSSGQVSANGALGGSQGTSNPFNRFRRWPSAKQPGLFEVRVTGLPTGYLERFILQIPSTPAATESPLLIGFHAQNVSMWDLYLSTSFPTEAEARGWFVLAPMAASQTNLSSVPAQQNVEIVLDLILEQYPIDRSRIYGVGFSMGGGTALSYAARHLNPDKAMFAALINHTGVCSQRHSYEYDCFYPVGTMNCPTQSEYEFWFGGPPATQAFEFAQCSLIDMDLLTGVVDPNTDFARNLVHIPIAAWLATQDPLTELIEQNFRIATWIFGKGGSYVLHTVVDNNHTWDNLDVTAACDFLAQRSLTIPTHADTLADRDDRWFHFDLVQDSAGAFSRFSWSVDALSNSVDLLATANIQSLRVDTASAGLDPASTLFVSTAAADGLGEQLSFTGYPNAPSAVTRDGLPFANWSHDPVADELLVFDSDGSAAHDWVITP